MSLLDPILDLLRGKAVTIPPMDGALKPNTALDDADVVDGGGDHSMSSSRSGVPARALRSTLPSLGLLLLLLPLRRHPGAHRRGDL